MLPKGSAKAARESPENPGAAGQCSAPLPLKAVVFGLKFEEVLVVARNIRKEFVSQAVKVFKPRLKSYDGFGLAVSADGEGRVALTEGHAIIFCAEDLAMEIFSGLKMQYQGPGKKYYSDSAPSEGAPDVAKIKADMSSHFVSAERTPFLIDGADLPMRIYTVAGRICLCDDELFKLVSLTSESPDVRAKDEKGMLVSAGAFASVGVMPLTMSADSAEAIRNLQAYDVGGSDNG